MTRDEARQLLGEKLKNQNLVKHCLATEACMRELARYFGENEDGWGLAGLLHDIDYEETSGDPIRHGNISADFLADKGLAPEIVYAVKVHAGHQPAKSKLDWSLFAADPLTGLIVASCLMHPDKKLKSLDADFVVRRFKEKRFAAGANRDQINACTNIGIDLAQFIDLCLKGMQGVAVELGL